MTDLPRVSIITPSYNQARFLEQSIRSVLEQDYPNIEYILMDGGSTDDSLQIIQKYSPRLAYWVSQPDAGQSVAINEGLRHATGDIWAWMNSDDAYLPGAVRKAVDWLQANPQADIAYGDCLVMNEAGQDQHYFHAPEFKLESALTGAIGIPSGSTFLRKSVYDRLGGFNESLHYSLDSDYWMRALLFCSFSHIPEALSLFRVYSAAKTWDVRQSGRRAREIVEMNQRFWHRADLPNNFRHFQSRSIANACLFAAQLSLQAGDRTTCVRHIRKSLTMGFPALKPRLLSLLVRLWFGERAANVLRNLWRKGQPAP